MSSRTTRSRESDRSPSPSSRPRVSSKLALGLLTLTVCAGCRSVPPPRRVANPGEVVLLLHGLFRGPNSLSTLHRYLGQAGYRVIDWSYPSSQKPLEDHAQQLKLTLEDLAADPQVSRIHLVGHSFGGLVARAAMLPEPRPKIGRIVTLATPHQGSPRARKLTRFFGGVVPPLPGLSDAEDSSIHKLGNPRSIDIGTVSGTKDGAVPEAHSRIEGEADHLRVESSHTFIMNKPEVLAGVIQFLRHGTFQKSPEPTVPAEETPISK